MPLHLIDGLCMWGQELGTADVVLVLGSYGWKKDKIDISRGYGAEAVKRFPTFSNDMWNYFKWQRKPMKNMKASCYGLALPTNTDYGSGTKIGLLQVRYGDGEDVDTNLLKHSISLLNLWASDYYRIAIEYPCQEVHGCKQDVVDMILDRVPQHVVFYRPAPPLKEVDYAAIGQSYAMGIKYERGGGNSNFHRR